VDLSSNFFLGLPDLPGRRLCAQLLPRMRLWHTRDAHKGRVRLLLGADPTHWALPRQRHLPHLGAEQGRNLRLQPHYVNLAPTQGPVFPPLLPPPFPPPPLQNVTQE